MIWWLKRWLRNRAYPMYECKLCVGQEYWQGCYCAYYNAFRPADGTDPTNGTWWQNSCRWLYNKIWGAPT